MMLERVLEPEVMDTQEDADEYATIDNDEVNRVFVDRVLEVAPRSGDVLDAGTGPGDIAILLARRAPGLRVLAIDLGDHMLAIARKNVAAAGLGDRVRVARADVKATGQPASSFDLIVSNSLVHHVPDPLLYFAEMMRVARPGAGFFIKDLHRPSSEAEHGNLVETYAKTDTAYQRRLFSDSLRAALTVDEVKSLCDAVSLTGVRVWRCSDRHWCLERRAEPNRTTGS
jgi:ubiquinone/menaquinone biosynthesis C-methylase UbiE